MHEIFSSETFFGDSICMSYAKALLDRGSQQSPQITCNPFLLLRCNASLNKTYGFVSVGVFAGGSGC
jgi:hypothetical protein